MKTDLKPCPFCGNKAEIDFFESECTWYIGCTNCTCEIQDLSEEKAISAWNTRHDEMTINKTLLLIVNIAVYSVVLAIVAALAWNLYQSFQ